MRDTKSDFGARRGAKEKGPGVNQRPWRAFRIRKNASEPIVLKLWARRHALGAFRPGQTAVLALAVLGAGFLLIDEIEGGDFGSAHPRQLLGQRRLDAWAWCPPGRGRVRPTSHRH